MTRISHTDHLAVFQNAKRIVVKIGSALLVDREGALRRDWLAALGEDLAQLHERGCEIVIVSSGAIALGRARLDVGRSRLGLTGKALTLSEKQACAASGQAQLTQAYEDVLSPHNIFTAQVLLTLFDTETRRRWLNARSTLGTLLKLGTVPIVNENDTVATDEIRYGDNDRLAARVAQMISADLLILLSDIDGLYTADPRKDSAAKRLTKIETITAEIEAMGGEPNAASGVGSGGMATKIAAAKIAVHAGAHMIITKGETHRPLSALKDGAPASWFVAQSDPLTARKQWIVGSLSPLATLTIDDGAYKALMSGKSLLPAGVTAVTGEFEKGDAVAITTKDGALVARGLITYDAADARKIMGLKSSDIRQALGYKIGSALIHRDDLVMEKAE